MRIVLLPFPFHPNDEILLLLFLEIHCCTPSPHLCNSSLINGIANLGTLIVGATLALRAPMASSSNVWPVSFPSLRFWSVFLPFLEAGAGWFVQVRESLKGKVLGCPTPRKATPLVTHKIKMASMRMSMEEVSKTYKITPVRR